MNKLLILRISKLIINGLFDTWRKKLDFRKQKLEIEEKYLKYLESKEAK